MNYEKDFDMIDAFMALKDLDDDSVSGMITSKRTSRKLHEGKGYPLHGSKESLEAAREFLNENDELALEVIDPDADSLEHIKDRIDYVGQMILRCNRCQANRFIDMDALVENPEEKDVYNIDDECPNCKTSGVGYEIIGQVGKYEEPEAEKPETETETSAEDKSSDDAAEEEEVAIENDSESEDELKFDNDEPSDEPSAESAEVEDTESAEVTEVDLDSDDESEPDMMETSTSEDDEDDIKVDDDEDDDDEEVKESLYRPAMYEDANKAAEYKKEALMYNKIMDQMADDGAQDAWARIWPNYESGLNNMSSTEIVDLKDAFEEIYRKYHNNGLLAADADVIKTCAALDKEFGLAQIENHHTYVESVEVISNTTISEVLGSLLDADRVGKIEITNRCDNKKDEKVYDGDYNNLPLNLANATCTGFDVNNRTLACNIDQEENHGRRPLADILSKFGDDKSDNIHLYDIASSDEVFKGKKADAIDKYGKCGFISIDTPAVIRLTICDPSIVCANCSDDASNEDKLVEHIITENDLSITRLNKVTTNEYWIAQSIKDREDLDIIYEAYVKPCGSSLIAEFKKVTGYSNALDEAFEAGYKAASEENVSEAIDTTEVLEWFVATCYSDSDSSQIAMEDFATVTVHPDGKFTVEGELMFSDGHDNIVDALAEAVESIPDADIYANIEISIEDELDTFVSDADKQALSARLGMIVEEVVDEESASVSEAFMSRDQLIAELRKMGKNYYFDKYTDEQIYMIHKRAIQQAVNKKAPNKSLSAKMDDLIADESDAIKQYDAAIDTVNASDAANKAEIVDTLTHIRDEEIEHIDELQKVAECDRCGARLNDSGTCPRCDHGEEDLSEKLDYDALYQKIENQEASMSEGIISNFLFNSTLANELYDEFYRPITNAIKSGDKEAAQKIYDEFKSDYDATDRSKYAKVFFDVNDARFAEYQNQIDAMESNVAELAPVGESLDESVDLELSRIVKDSINHMINDLGYDPDHEEFSDDVLADIEDNYDVDVPTDPRSYAAWSSEIFSEISRQLVAMPECMTEDVDDDFDDWVDDPAEAPAAEAEEPMDRELLRQIVDEEMPFAIKEWGTSISKLTNHFLTVMEEAMFQKPNVAELKELIAEYLENRDTDANEAFEAFQSFKSRKDLAAAITECKNNSRPYTVRRSIREGYRYDLILEADNTGEESDTAKESADQAPGSHDTVQKEKLDLTEGDNLPAQVEEISVALTAEESEVNAKIMRISQDIAQAILDVYGIEADPALIVADILQDLGLISGDIKPEDLEDTALNRATIDMYKTHEAFWLFMDALASALGADPITMTSEAKIKRAVKALSGPNFSTSAIRQGIESTQFHRLVAQGKVPFVPAGSTPLLIGEALDDESSDIDVNVEKFDSDMNEYFNEAYEDTTIYTTTSGTVNPDGSMILEGVIMTEDVSSDVSFTLTPDQPIDESLSRDMDIKSKLESLDYTVTNNVSEEVFSFNFKD